MEEKGRKTLHVDLDENRLQVGRICHLGVKSWAMGVMDRGNYVIEEMEEMVDTRRSAVVGADGAVTDESFEAVTIIEIGSAEARSLEGLSKSDRDVRGDLGDFRLSAEGPCLSRENSTPFS